MEYLELAQTRHAVKKFDRKKVPLEEIKDIIKTARLAPSGINIQSWHFVVIDSAEAKAALLKEVNPSNHEQIETAGGLIMIFADSQYADRLKLISERGSEELSSLDIERFTQRYQAYVNSFDAEYLNTYMSMTTGLGYKRTEKINEILNVDKKYRPELIIPFGTSEETGQPSFRLGLEDIMEIR
ncbi:nitroreductase family protein [Lactococcus petauri]|uniref:nitroreductase family protein n=1 Tax=Lactococcus petauri TaxID=1940789 RepID=UPI00288F3D6C|nr:nitroreductase family protein [Lactococcus petauri]MDT2551974.1 nitroreductase family protein [Lactococcus petauri]MDT2581422.1 nitroreductase family protein [Lactococcus petauri]